MPVSLGLASAAGLFQLGSGIAQKIKANNLTKSNYVPPQLLMNKDLAQQQAFSRRSPGAAFAEEQNRRLQANQINGAQRMFGGDANKIAAVTAGATQQAQDANSRIAQQGQQFSENAYGRLSNANNALAQNDRQNQNQYVQTKASLNNAGNTNLFSGVSNIASAGLVALGAKGNVAAKDQINAQYPTMDDSDPSQYNQNLKRIKLRIGGNGKYNQNLYQNQMYYPQFNGYQN